MFSPGKGLPAQQLTPFLIYNLLGFSLFVFAFVVVAGPRGGGSSFWCGGGRIKLKGSYTGEMPSPERGGGFRYPLSEQSQPLPTIPLSWICVSLNGICKRRKSDVRLSTLSNPFARRGGRTFRVR